LGARTVGFFGGGSMVGLGPASDMQLFFDCIDAHAVARRPRADWALVTDRLYRRYVRLEDVGVTRELLGIIQEEFSRTPVAEVDWNGRARAGKPSALNPKMQNLGQVFARYIASFHEIAEESVLAWESAKSEPGYSFQAPRVCLADLAATIEEQDRPLAEYDSLEGPPLWQR